LADVLRSSRPYRWRPLRALAGSLALVILTATIGVTPVLGKLMQGAVSPRSGTMATSYTFSVRSTTSLQTVTAHLTAPGKTAINIDLNRPTGGKGTWSRSAKIPTPATWAVTFIGTPGSQTASGGTFTVTAAPSPTPSPRPSPTPLGTPVPVVTPRPTSVPKPTAAAAAAGTPTGSPTPTPTASAAATPVVIGGATQPSSPPSAQPASGTSTPPADRSGTLLIAVLLGLFVILGVGGIALLGGRRRAEEQPTELAADGTGAAYAGADAAAAAYPTASYEPVSTDPSAFAARVNARTDEPAPEDPLAVGGPRARTAWEAYIGLEDEPIGTVDRVAIDPQPRPWDAGAPPRAPADRVDDDAQDDERE
jgi:hypothetical protein